MVITEQYLNLSDQEIKKIQVKINFLSQENELKTQVAWDPFLERPGNLPGPESDFDINVSRKVGLVLTSDEVHFVS